ncbi:unnamed protein product [Mycena citricolor]|uniref:Uncharacterized protein n=1 Tax=Mycena citricolor TaxID=2018698 RepID=A0AAD2Q7Y0_9AGAR|nr:unnamed protein product [Mycena citricolor]
MKFSLSSYSALGLLLAVSSLNALYLPPSEDQAPFSVNTLARRVVYSPPIISPGSGTIWKLGSDEVVTWSTADIPSDVTNSKGKILLGYLEEGSSNEHLDVEHPLAQGFDIHDGQAHVQVPADIPPKSSYIVVLMGDSGNRSPPFTIS